MYSIENNAVSQASIPVGNSQSKGSSSRAWFNARSSSVLVDADLNIKSGKSLVPYQHTTTLLTSQNDADEAKVLQAYGSNITLMHNNNKPQGATAYTGYGETIESSTHIGLNKYKMIAAEK